MDHIGITILAGLVLCTVPSAFADNGEELTVCDFDDHLVDWRSKFRAHTVGEAERAGKETNALRLTYDLSEAPHYDWFRAVVDEPIDVTPYKYLSFWLHSDDNAARLIPMFIKETEPSPEYPNGEIVAAASHHPVVLAFTGWKRFSVPLEAFQNLKPIAGAVDQINFSLPHGSQDSNPGQLMLDDLRLTTTHQGEVVEEAVPFPPADIAIADEAEFFSLFDLSRPGLQEVRAAVEAGDWQAAKQAWADHLKNRDEPKWRWSWQDREQIRSLFDEESSGLARNVPAADRILAREFSFLGVHKTLHKDIQWLQGPVEWTHVLSRHHYWKTLGYAWWATRDHKYPEDWVYMLRDWIADNPVPRICTNSRGKHGTVWRTLETGIRGDVWFDIMELFMDASQFDAEAKYLMTKSLVEHARHLHRYTVTFRYGNWQVVECTGLATIGIMLPEFNESESWRQRAFDYLVKHMERDVYPDGAHHELTPGYHGWVMRRYLQLSILAKKNGYDVPGLMARHEKMFEFLMYISKPDRRYPPLGDAGRGGSIRDEMALGALVYDRPDMRYLALDEARPHWVWLFGPDVIDQYDRIEKRPPDFTSAMLPHAQYCMMRTGWERDDMAMLFDCAPWGGGHSHQDRLQVILYAGRDLLIDSGQYSYDQPLSHRYFRQSEAHNILLIDDQRQLQSAPQILAWSVTDQLELASGKITGDGLAHQRTVLFVKPEYWIVVDHVSGSGNHTLTRQYHLPLVDTESGATWTRTAYDSGTNVWLAVTDGATLEIRDGLVPTGSATVTEAPVATFTNEAELPATLCTVVIPYEDTEKLPTVEAVPGQAPSVSRLRVVFPDGQTDTVAIAPKPMDIAVDDHAAHGRAVCIRRGPRADQISIVEGNEITER